ncbi:MAG TPA: LytR C-terminal domain-containing protein [Gaiellales bacterium]|nr:LytR C-terminal domain-containing protein [Gaiellales bacterium]
MTRLLAIGLLLAAIATVFVGILWHGGSGSPPAAATNSAHGGSANAVTTVHHARTGGKATSDNVKTPPKKTTPPAKPHSHKPAKPIPLPGKTPVMVLNSNGIHGVAHQLAAKVQGAGYPITYVGNAQKRGLPTIVQYAKGYGPAARKLARLVGNVQFVTPFDGITPSQARGAKLVVILGT